MASDNFMNHLSPDDWSGTQIKGADQRAAEVRVQLKEECRAQRGTGACMPMEFQAHSKEDYDTMRVVNKRKERGGANFKVGDAF